MIIKRVFWRIWYWLLDNLTFDIYDGASYTERIRRTRKQNVKRSATDKQALGQ